MNIRLVSLLAGCGLAALASVAAADPPGRVGRISWVEGEVSLMPPGEADWTYAVPNFPVTDGEALWTDDDGRAEIQVGAVEVSADSQTDLDVLTLDYGQTRLGLTQGSIDVRLWRLPPGGVAIATPVGDILLNQAGIYRVDVGAVDENGDYPPVEVSVFAGDASVPGPSGYSDLAAGGAAVADAGYDPSFQPAQDASIDDWARQRDATEDWQAQADYSAALSGYEDLPANGQFVQDPDLGTVWFPNAVPVGWAPYRYGRWAYVAPWGYTWIDDQPWGFAPFHYGRWAQVGGRWGWLPGQPTAQPVYAPALVAFVGGGGSVGWIPLGPDEVYRPTYQVSPAYLRQVNAANVSVTTINNITINTTVDVTRYRNAGAAVAVAPEAFAGGRSIAHAAAPIAPTELAQVRPAAPLPPPTAEARGGFRPGGGASEGLQGPAARPPAQLQAVRAAVAAQPTGSPRVPPIPGAHIAPPGQRPTGVFVAPAQMKNPAAQGRRPVAPLAGPAPQAPRPAEPAYRPNPEAGRPAPPPAAAARPPEQPSAPPRQPAYRPNSDSGPPRTTPAPAPEARPPQQPSTMQYRPAQAQPPAPTAARPSPPSEKPPAAKPAGPPEKKPDSDQRPPP